MKLKIGHYYLIESRFAKDKGKERIIAKYLGEDSHWESQSIELFRHSCYGKGKLGYCMFDSRALVIKEIPKEEIWVYDV